MGSLFHYCGAATEEALSPAHFCVFGNQDVQAMTRTGGNWAKAESVNHQTIIHVLGAEFIQWLVNVKECLENYSFGDAKPEEVHEQWSDVARSWLHVN